MNYSKLIKQKGIAVDIDETLAWTVGYWFQKLTNKFGNPENLSTQELVSKYRYTQNAPYLQKKEHKEWMNKKRLCDKTQEDLPIIENADHYLNKISKIVPISTYLTIRPEQVRLGTGNWLKKHDFPQAPIILKPEEVDFKDGYQWKAQVLSDLYPRVVGMIDDNLELVNSLPKNYQGKIFIYDMERSDDFKIEKDFDAVFCPSWKDVYKSVEKCFS